MIASFKTAEEVANVQLTQNGLHASVVDANDFSLRMQNANGLMMVGNEN